MRTLFVVLVSVSIATFARADLDTIGPDGINSLATGLDGTGTLIGMVDRGRPGKPGKDLPIYVNDSVIPTQVYVGNMIDGANSFWVMDDPGDERGTHAVSVAGVMIANSSGPLGVAPATSLHAGSTDGIMGLISLAVAGNRIARISDMRAINMSFGLDATPNSLSTLTLFIDWSSRVHDVLYVVATADDINNAGVPEDNFNGITVGASWRLNGGVAGSYRQVWPDNIITDLAGDRSAIEILAPGFDFSVPLPGNGTDTGSFGTSFAAPHVTGAVALLQQFGNFQVTMGNP